MNLFSIFRRKKSTVIDKIPDELSLEHDEIATCSRCTVKENGVCPFPYGCSSLKNVADSRIKALRAARGVDDTTALSGVAKCLKGTIIKREFNSKAVSYMITDVGEDGSVCVSEKIRYTKSGKIWTGNFVVTARVMMTAYGSKVIDVAELWKSIIHHEEVWIPGKK